MKKKSRFFRVCYRFRLTNRDDYIQVTFATLEARLFWDNWGCIKNFLESKIKPSSTKLSLSRLSESPVQWLANLTHNWKVAGSNLIQYYMKMASKPCQDWFLHPILVHSIIGKKENTGRYKWGTPKKYFIKACRDSWHSLQISFYYVKVGHYLLFLFSPPKVS